MRRQDFRLERYGWGVRVYYAVNGYRVDEILSDMEHIGCDGEMLERARGNMWGGGRDKGVTYSNLDRRRTVMVIGLTSSAKEFEKSWRHECGHLAMHMAQALGIDPWGEEVQYLGDDIVEEMWAVAKGFLCDCCRAGDRH